MHENRKPGSPYLKWILAFVIYALAVLDTFVGPAALLGFAVFVYVVVFCHGADTLFVIVFSLSFANIFKLSPSSQSMFTYIMLGYVVYKLLLGHTVSNDFWVTFVLMILFACLQALMAVNVLRSIKFLANFLFLYFAMEDAIGHQRDIFLGYTAGVLTGSATAWLKIVPKLNRYVKSKSIGVNEVNLNRFSGIYDDPNYYVVNVIIALCLVVLLYHRRELKTVPFVILSLALIFFSVMTYSKSAFLMLAFPVLLFLYTNSRNGRYFLQLTCVVGLFAFLLLLVAGKISFFAAVMERLQEAQNVNQLTTGRFGLWQKYMEKVLDSPIKMLIGNGIGAGFVGHKGAHNTYIDLIYYLGTVGITLVLRMVAIVARDFQPRPFRRNFTNYSVILVIVAMYFFLSELFYFDLPFHLLMAILVYNMEDKKYAVGLIASRTL